MEMERERQLIMLPGPTNVPDRVMLAMMRPMINHRGPEFAALLDSVTEGLKYVFETKEDVYVLTSSGTGAVECAISNVVDPGDKVIVPVFGFFSERLKDKVAHHGGKVVEIPVEWGKAPTTEQIETAIRKEKDVKLIAVVHNETSTGVTVHDLPEMAQVAVENNALLMADSISILGGDHLPVDKWEIDLCVTGSQKCLAIPPGLAMISVGKRAWEAIEKKKVKPPYYFALPSIRDHWLRKETPFTPAISLYYALNESLKMIREEGLEKRFQRHATCAKAFYAGFEALGLKPFAAEHVRSNTVVTVSSPYGVDVNKVREIMKERYKVVIAGGLGKIRQSILRVGCMGAISEVEVLTTINALGNTLTDLNHPVQLGAANEAAKHLFR
ncbi:MAG TPA: alanine--glyoxylate aminotransferase family protein [Candidatus Bathyarchaeia archaeon]|nr:alanine--glyoxylate aminotransferase family protein [Candidatus Bathyarchaeia archaeon]